MNYNFIRDPVTNISYTTTTDKGLSILKKYIKFLNGSGKITFSESPPKILKDDKQNIDRESGFTREGMQSLKDVHPDRDFVCKKGQVEPILCSKPEAYETSSQSSSEDDDVPYYGSKTWEYPCYVDEDNMCYNEDGDLSVVSSNNMIRKLELRFNKIRYEASVRRKKEKENTLSEKDLPLNWWRSMKDSIDTEFGESLLDKYEWSPPIYEKKVLPVDHKDQDDFHTDGDLLGEPNQHFLNQTVRIPNDEKNGPTPRKVLQLALNVGQGIEDKIIEKEWTMYDFIEKKIHLGGKSGVLLPDENGNINCINCENCYNCVNCTNCINCINCVDCEKCVDCDDCKKCTNWKMLWM